MANEETAMLAERIVSELDAIHTALWVAYGLPPHRQAGVRAILHLTMVSLTRLKIELTENVDQAHAEAAMEEAGHGG